MVYFLFQECLNILTVIFFPTWTPAVSMNVGLNLFLETMNFLFCSFIINQFPISGLTGMYLAMLASGTNFGNLKFIHVKLTGVFGWTPCAIFGVSLQMFIILIFPRWFHFSEKGKININPEFLENPNQS